MSDAREPVRADFQQTVLRAGCKINLNLVITGRRDDGYHLLDSVFHPLDEPHDTLTVRPGERPGLALSTAEAGIDPHRNTLTRAWSVFAEATGLEFALDVDLEKGIPWGAGLGGGSSDAAVLLRFLASLAAGIGRPVAEAELHAMAAGVGADVPFFLVAKPCRVTGIGDRLEILEPGDLDLPGRELLLVMPDVKVSTPWAYRAYDEASERGDADRHGSVTQLPRKNAETLTGPAKASKECLPKYSPAGLFVNDLEDVVFGQHPEIRAVRDHLLQLGACAACMSGSGSSVFGVFKEHSTACAAASAMPWRVQHCALSGM
ncbi:MAG: 4-(cytidine 5'-diphospho)-2-C-methyl-D-erythritol kinase [Desulfovibrionaceae bacterium]|nr:4-(cytidine 5'-diphospho)-2-C-methyl-D-erythritol kinase [Desulfovibrionaceae bacterium]